MGQIEDARLKLDNHEARLQKLEALIAGADEADNIGKEIADAPADKEFEELSGLTVGLGKQEPGADAPETPAGPNPVDPPSPPVDKENTKAPAAEPEAPAPAPAASETSAPQSESNGETDRG